MGASHKFVLSEDKRALMDTRAGRGLTVNIFSFVKFMRKLSHTDFITLVQQSSVKLAIFSQLTIKTL